MIREIGSEFWNVPVSNQENGLFPDSVQWFLSGRSALKEIVREIGKENDPKSVAMPSWCCESMVKPFLDNGYTVNYYPVCVRDDFCQDIDFNSDVLYVMDYFGYTGKKADLSNYQGIIIRDVTHSVFSQAYDDADYYYGSLRKWCGLWTGGFAWGKNIQTPKTTDKIFADLRCLAMDKKRDYIQSCANSSKNYLGIFEEAENRLDQYEISAAHQRDIALAKKADTGFIISRRRKNAKTLMDAFRKLLIFHDLKETDCPMFVPILVPSGKRDSLRRYLIDHSIYCPAHWPESKDHRLNEEEKYIYRNELSLVCDQRYSEDEMGYLVDTVNDYLMGI